MVLKKGRFGQFLACSGYPDCKTTKQLGEAQKPKDVPLDEKCPQCWPYKFGQGGMEPVTQTNTRKFAIDQEPSAQGPSMLRVEVDGVTYHMMPPGSRAQGMVLDVYNASRQPGPVKVSKHMILFQPTGRPMVILRRAARHHG